MLDLPLQDRLEVFRCQQGMPPRKRAASLIDHVPVPRRGEQIVLPFQKILPPTGGTDLRMRFRIRVLPHLVVYRSGSTELRATHIRSRVEFIEQA
ncbi:MULTISPECIES: hypothetical protein [Rhodanobacteraceae]|uniref:hypothetical protein n=1 Tax=Rhodanobacteraceae TaxID=1775411 RepID=UPI000B82776F|nr:MULTISPECIES: hypothetical protein [Rhodanobacteraceae]